MNISKTIKEIRKKRGLTQSQLSEMSGITQTYLSQLESGSRQPRKEVIESISKSLGITPSMIYLLSSSDEDVPDNKKESYNDLINPIRNLILNIIEDEASTD